MSKYKIVIIYSLFLLIFTIYLLLDTFVLSSSLKKVESNISSKINYDNVKIDENNYQDDNIKISISEIRKNDTNIYIADVYVKDSDFLKTAFAKSIYGKNVVDTTSNIASSVSAILAINGDY